MDVCNTINNENDYNGLKLNLLATGSLDGFTIKWFKNGEELIEHQHFSRIDPKTASIIVISTATSNIKRYGTYEMQVVVSNTYGQISKQFQLEIRLDPIPEPTQPRIEVSPTVSQSITPAITPQISKVIAKQSLQPISDESLKAPISSASYTFSFLLLLVSIFVSFILL